MRWNPNPNDEVLNFQNRLEFQGTINFIIQRELTIVAWRNYFSPTNSHLMIHFYRRT